MTANGVQLKYNILVSEKLGAAGLDLLKATGANVDTSYDLTPEQLVEKIKDVDALIIRSGTQVTREVFEASKGRLKVVGRAGVGVDNVDLAAATEHGCLVVNAPTANTVAAAEHGIALLCALSRNVAQADASMKRGEWKRSKFTGVSLAGKTLAVIGFGKVGAEVGRRGKGLGLNVIAFDPYASEAKANALGVKLVSWDDALSQADFLSMHLPLTPGTKNIFNDDAFSKMKKGAKIINVGRGGCIDEPALVRALDAGIVSQAALDVFPVEPPVDNPLVTHEKVVVTPHLGASTVEAQEEVAVEVAEAVIVALKGELGSTAVNAPMVAADVLAELRPYTRLAEGLGKAVQLVEGGVTRVTITYHTPRGDDLDTRLLRAMVIKGILEQITESNVNIVNADLLAKNRGIKIVEITQPSDGREVLTGLEVALDTEHSKFGPALVDKQIRVQGTVKNGEPYLTKIGNFDVDIEMQGEVLLIHQQDKPGLIAAVSTILGRANINISFMTVSRVRKGEHAIMAIGVDSNPPKEVLDEIARVNDIVEAAFVLL